MISIIKSWDYNMCMVTLCAMHVATNNWARVLASCVNVWKMTVFLKLEVH